MQGELEQLKRENAKRLKALGEEIKEGYYVALDAYSSSVITLSCMDVATSLGPTCIMDIPALKY